MGFHHTRRCCGISSCTSSSGVVSLCFGWLSKAMSLEQLCATHAAVTSTGCGLGPGESLGGCYRTPATSQLLHHVTVVRSACRNSSLAQCHRDSTWSCVEHGLQHDTHILWEVGALGAVSQQQHGIVTGRVCVGWAGLLGWSLQMHGPAGFAAAVSAAACVLAVQVLFWASAPPILLGRRQDDLAPAGRHPSWCSCPSVVASVLIGAHSPACAKVRCVA